MRHEAFQIGLEFECGGQRWRCTDLGTRTVIAIALEHPEDPSWYNGPPYAVVETVLTNTTWKRASRLRMTPKFAEN